MTNVHHKAPAPSLGYSLQGTLALITAALCGVVWASAVTKILLSPVGHDQTWCLYAANLVLNGTKLNGPTLVEVNPPFLIWFHFLPVLLSRLLHVGILDGFRYFSIAVFAILGVWSTFLFKKLYKPTMFGLWLFILVESYAAHYFQQTANLGQREHFVSLLLMPYLIVAAYRMERKTLPAWESILVGLCAAIGICLKPQHLIDIVLVEALILFELRSVRAWFHTSGVTFALGLITYFCSVRLFAADYLTNIVPILSATYWGFDEPMRNVARLAKIPVLLLLLDSLVYLVLRKKLRIRGLIAVLLAASVGALLAYLQQHKGWTYQLICFKFLTYMLFGLLSAEILQSLVKERSSSPFTLKLRYPLFASLIVFLAANAYTERHYKNFGYSEDDKQILSDVYREYPAGSNVAFLSVYPWQFPAVVEQNKVWSSRSLHLWLLPALIKSQDPEDVASRGHLSAAKLQELSAMLRTSTAVDLSRWKPVVVAVEPCGEPILCLPLQREHFQGLIDWMSVDPGFREAWSHYSLEKTVGTLQIYTRTR